jgi:hypothetical protein
MAMHAENRKRIVDAMAQTIPDGSAVILIMGGKSETRYDTDESPLFRQESYFHWLFGAKVTRSCMRQLGPNGRLCLHSSRSFYVLCRSPISLASSMCVRTARCSSFRVSLRSTQFGWDGKFIPLPATRLPNALTCVCVFRVLAASKLPRTFGTLMLWMKSVTPTSWATSFVCVGFALCAL